MDRLNSTEDKYSFAQPAFARVSNISLKLRVDFDIRILEGAAVLDIIRKPTADRLTLDTKSLVISEVINFTTGLPLKYEISPEQNIGECLTIHLPDQCHDQLSLDLNLEYQSCLIQIKYKTKYPNQSLVWLTPEQTADDKYPFLVSNNKYTYARALFPCQDTPSVKFTYQAEIRI